MEPLFQIHIRYGRINERCEWGERVADNQGDGWEVWNREYAAVEGESEVKETRNERGKDEQLHMSTEWRREGHDSQCKLESDINKEEREEERRNDVEVEVGLRQNNKIAILRRSGEQLAYKVG